MIAAVTIRYKGAVPGIAQRELNRIKKACWELAGIHWHQQMREKHFTKAGATEYGYQPRSGESGRSGSKGFRRSYTGRKLAKYGHTRPLVLTGESAQLTRQRDVRATSRGVRVVLHANKYNFRARGSQINMREEMTTISVQEAIELAHLIDAAIGQRLAALGITETKTIH